MQKEMARRKSLQEQDRVERHEDLPTWRKTRPRANQEIHRGDLKRSTERLETLLGH